jgi:hypothetical protein
MQPVLSEKIPLASGQNARNPLEISSLEFQTKF